MNEHSPHIKERMEVVDPDDAEAMGAFEEDALSLEEATGSLFDDALDATTGEPRHG